MDKTYLLPRTLVRSRAYEAAVEEYALYAWRPLPAKDALYYAVALLKTGRRDEAARVLEMTEMPDGEAGDTGGVQGVTSEDVEAACDGLLAYADSLPEDVFVDELGESRGRHWTGVLTIPLEVLLRIAFAVL